MSDNRKIRRRQRCPECGSLDIIKWGVRNGKQRLKCRNCKSLFSARRKDISKSNLFQYIDNPGLPRTTNSLEAFFGHVKDQLRLHRGLSETRVDNFIKWYLYFNDEKKKNR